MQETDQSPRCRSFRKTPARTRKCQVRRYAGLTPCNQLLLSRATECRERCADQATPLRLPVRQAAAQEGKLFPGLFGGPQSDLSGPLVFALLRAPLCALAIHDHAAANP